MPLGPSKRTRTAWAQSRIAPRESSPTCAAIVLALTALLLFSGCSSTAARDPIRVRAPRAATVRPVEVEYVRVMRSGGVTIVEPLSVPEAVDTRPENLGVVIWPAENFEANVVEQRRERDQLRAAPWWVKP